ncbi:hypothetical protein [Burkholderia gladioli]|uniref:hypothetical protein n=1 Tax=Burkholderia gladioli TaxID=28095 RepID=UPI0034DB2999
MTDKLSEALSMRARLELSASCITALEALSRTALGDTQTQRMCEQMTARIIRNQKRILEKFENACYAVRFGREFS